MNRPLLFLHIPKTAGTTLNSILEGNFPREDVLSFYDRDSFKKMGRLSHEEFQRLKLIQGHMFIHDFERFFTVNALTFTMLREPLARVVSEYEFLRSWPKQHLYRYMTENKVSLVEYVTSQDKKLAWRGKNLMCRSLAGSEPPCPDDATLLAQAISHLERFDVVGLTEMFDESLLLLQNATGLQNLLYEQCNVQHKARRPEDLHPEELEAVRQANLLDLELHAHASRLVQERVAAAGPAFQARLRFFRKLNRRYQSISAKVLQRSNVRQDAKEWTVAPR